jgi:hypothetical protein
MSRRRYKRIPGTNLAIIQRVPSKPRPRQEIVVSTPRLPKPVTHSHISYHIDDNASADDGTRLRFYTAILNYLARSR